MSGPSYGTNYNTTPAVTPSAAKPVQHSLFFQDPQAEINWINQFERQRTQALNATTDWNLVSALRAAHMAKVAPWLQPGLLLALGKSPDSIDPLQTIATMSAVQRSEDNPTNNNIGEQTIAMAHVPGLYNNLRPGQANFEMREQEAVRPFAANAPKAIQEAEKMGLIDAHDNLHMPDTANSPAMAVFRGVIAEWAKTHPHNFVPVIGSDGAQGYYDQALGDFVRHTGPTERSDHMIEEGVPIPHKGFSLGNIVGRTLNLGHTAQAAGSGVGDISSFLTTHRLPTLPGPLANIQTQPYEGAPQTPAELVTKPLSSLSQAMNTYGPPTLPGPASDLQYQRAGPATPQNWRQLAQEAGMAGAAPLQELNGVARNAYGAITGRDVNWWEPQSDFLIHQTMNTSAGDGLLVDPDSATARERLRREQERGLIDGHTFTFGRALAHYGAVDLGLVEPDSVSYNVLSGLVDAAVAIKSDPTAWATGKLGEIQEARQTFRPEGAEQAHSLAGLVKGVYTNSIWRQAADAWLDSSDGKAIVNAMTNEASAGTIWKQTGRKLDRATSQALADADTPEQVREVLKPLLGVEFRTTKSVWKPPHTFVLDPLRIAGDSTRAAFDRALTDVPSYAINPYDDNSVMRQTEAWLVNAHVKPNVVNGFLDRMAKTQNPGEVLEELDNMMRHSEGVLGANGVPKPLIDKLVDGWRTELRTAQKTQLDAALDHIQGLDETAISEDIFGTGSPLLWAEQQATMLPLPDYRVFRRLSSDFPNLAWDAEGKLKLPVSAIQGFQDRVWKPFQLLRLAWPVRVISEEQARMGAAGMASIFHNPASFIAFAIGRKGDLSGDPFELAQQFQESLSRKSGGFLTEAPNRVRLGAKQVFERGDEGFSEAWANEILDLSHSDLAKRMAQDGLGNTRYWWLNGEGRGAYEAEALKHPALADETVASRYLESLSKRIGMKTNGDTELLDAIRTGQFRGKDIFDRAKGQIDGDFLAHLKTPGALSESPDQVVGLKSLLGGDAYKATKKDPFTTRMFGMLMSKPSNYLSRSPVFRQAYWKRVAELIEFADPAEKEAILQGARDSYVTGIGPVKLGGGLVRKMEGTEAIGRLTAAEVDMHAKGYALDYTKDLLYDLSRKSQIADSMRIVSPFAEAWKEVWGEWARLMNPTTGRGLKNIRRAWQAGQQLIQSKELGNMFGAPTDLAGHQQGVFWRDEFGELNFVYPGSQWLNQQKWAHIPDWVPIGGGFGAPGMPVPLTGRVKGLSMFGSVIPGLGPVASIPAAYLIQDEPGWQRTVRDTLLPFGSFTDQQGAVGTGNLVNFAPSWMRTGINALLGKGFEQQSNRLYANDTMRTANYLYSTGKYDTTSVAGWNKLMSDAKKMSRNLTMVKAFVSFGAPAAPRTDFLVNTNHGMIRFAALRDEYINLLGADPTTADEKFLHLYGKQVGMVMQAFTREVDAGLVPSTEFGDWVKSHQDIQRDFPNTFSFFGPQVAKGGGKPKFDYNVYIRQILGGQREQLTLDEWRRLGENHLGQMVLDAAQAEVGPNPSDTDQQWLDDTKDWVYKHYPGFGDLRGTEQRADSVLTMRELEAAVHDQRILKTKAGKALAGYMQARNEVLSDAKDQGFKTFNGQDFASDREWLFETGNWYAKNTPEFKPLWERVLRNEVEPVVTG